MTPTASLRDIPSIDELLSEPLFLSIQAEAGRRTAAAIAREAADVVRSKVVENGTAETGVLDIAAALWETERRRGVRKVINATGVIVHTNLGRSALPESAVRAIAEEASRYCTLEYDLATGKRGRRGERAESLICDLTGAEAAVIVNNCAAAAFLVLRSLAAGKEVIISRGELVEIGGDFRVPDVLAESGAILREVGTTNRTKLKDYENAINENTGLILRVHPSNYRIVGFTASPSNKDIAALARAREIPFFEDAGSGALVDLSDYGLGDEPLISRSIADGADIVAFSGDKLCGGVQSGFIVGKAAYIDRVRKHPLYRALRVDKIAYAAIEATLKIYLREKHFEDIPTLRMLSITTDELRIRSEKFVGNLRERIDESIDLEILEGESVIGGGSAPDVKPKTWLIAISQSGIRPEKIERKLRLGRPPVIARVTDDRVVIDLRTVFEHQEEMLIDAVARNAEARA